MPPRSVWLLPGRRRRRQSLGAISGSRPSGRGPRHHAQSHSELRVPRGSPPTGLVERGFCHGFGHGWAKQGARTMNCPGLWNFVAGQDLSLRPLRFEHPNRRLTPLPRSPPSPLFSEHIAVGASSVATRSSRLAASWSRVWSRVSMPQDRAHARPRLPSCRSTRAATRPGGHLSHLFVMRVIGARASRYDRVLNAGCRLAAVLGHADISGSADHSLREDRQSARCGSRFPLPIVAL